MTETITFSRGRDGGGRDRELVRIPQLVLALRCSEPTARPARFSLKGLDRVLVGRGPARNLVRVTEGGEKRLRIHVPDGFMSSSHLRMIRRDGGWIAEDAGSKNGTLLNGVPLDSAPLADRDILTVGNTLFIHRSEMAAFAGEQDVDLSGTGPEDAATATLDAELAASFERLMRVAASNVPILIRGDTGTGKELVCRTVHARSGRTGPMVAVNCGGLPVNLITSELFGARKGAYSGATESRLGLVRSADGGTLFLDEIAELPLDTQAALLRVLQENEVLPVGADKPVAVDVRVVAATHRDLARAVAEGTFREDLYARVAGYELGLPPLALRQSDLGLIIGTLLEKAGQTKARLTPEAAHALFAYDWPRNIRELEHCLTSALAVADDALIRVEDLPELRGRASGAGRALDEAGRLTALMQQHGGNVSAVARALSTSRSQVRRMAKRLGIDPESFRR